MNDKKIIPFIPQKSRSYKDMKHVICETDTTTRTVARSEFMHHLEEQPCPMGQVYVDFDDGVVYLFPYEPERAENFTANNRKFWAEYKRIYRERHDPRADCLRTVLHYDQFTDSEKNVMESTWLASEETPESIYLVKERMLAHREAFDSLPDSDREILTAFVDCGYNARELARRLGKDPSGVLKLVKRAADRLQKKFEENL